MADPIGAISLGLTVAGGLLRFYTNLRGQTGDIEKMARKLSRLLQLFSASKIELQKIDYGADDSTLAKTIEPCIVDAQELIHDLDEELNKFQMSAAESTLRTTGRRVAYPFRRSTLLKLEEDIDSLVDVLTFAFGISRNIQIRGLQTDVHGAMELLSLVRGSQVNTDIENWLQAPDAGTNLSEAASRKQPGTGLWLTQSPWFSSWLQERSSFLWLTGFAGSGKTVLCATAILSIFRQRQARSTVGIAFFFFTFSDARKQDASSMLRAVLLQLSGQLGDDHNILSSLRKSYKDTIPPNQALMSCLRQLLRRFRDVYIVLDALDESPWNEHRGTTLDIVAELRSWKERSLHLMVSGRDEIDIRDGLRATVNEKIYLGNATSASDIELYIAKSLRTNRQLRKWEANHGLIKASLMERADGVFRWVECQLKAVERCARSDQDLEMLLSSLPDTLEGTYERMLRNISTSSKSRARAIFTMLCCSKRPLTADELLEGLSVELEGKPKFNSKRQLKDIEAIEEICPGFLEFDIGVDTSQRTIRLAHFSVQQYLESERLRNTADVAIFSVTREVSNYEMACVCLTILNEPEVPRTELAEPNREPLAAVADSRPRMALGRYAAQFWPAHYQNGNRDSLIEDQIWELFSRQDRFRAWLALYNTDGLCGTPKPLYYASLLGLDFVVRKILISSSSSSNSMAIVEQQEFLPHAYDSVQNSQQSVADFPSVNETGGYYRTSLLAASVGGHDSIVHFLLMAGADMHVKDAIYGTALHAAAHNGRLTTAKLLLDLSSKAATLPNGDKKGRRRATPFASQLCTLSVFIINTFFGLTIWMSVSLPLFDNEFMDTFARIAMVRAASIIRYSWMTWLPCMTRFAPAHSPLLRDIVDVDDKDKYGRTSLALAAENGHDDVAMLLLGRGASVGVQDAYRRTPLSYAAEQGNVSLVQLLLENGALDSRCTDASIKTKATAGAGDAENMSPLHYTVRYSAVDVARLLLKHGMPVDIAVHRRAWVHQSDPSGSQIICEPCRLPFPGRDGDGLTPLHYASWCGSSKMVRFFLQHGANPNARSMYGETPFHLAVSKAVNGPQFSEYRDYWTEDDWRVEVIYDLAVSEGDMEELESAQQAVSAARMSVFDAFIADSRTDLFATDDGGETVLHKLRYGQSDTAEFVRKLLQRNLECGGRHEDNRMPLQLACLVGDTTSVRHLANSAEALAHCDIYGENSLHLACRSGMDDTILSIIASCDEYSIDLSSTETKTGKSALHCLAEGPLVSSEAVQALIVYGVRPFELDADGRSALSLYKARPLFDPEPEICTLLED